MLSQEPTDSGQPPAPRRESHEAQPESDDQYIELEAEQEEVLLELATHGELRVDSIKRRLGISDQMAIYLVEQLVEFGMVWTDADDVDTFTTVGIDRDGRKYLAERGQLD